MIVSTFIAVKAIEPIDYQGEVNACEKIGVAVDKDK